MILSGQNSGQTPSFQEVEKTYGDFLTALGYNWREDTNMKDTPRRVAKMMLQEITKGSYCEPPKITTFENIGEYTGMVFQGNIQVKSLCSHHILPFIGKAHVAYIPKENSRIVGLSKLNRIVDWFARRPQLQEQLTTQIHNYLHELIGDSLGVAVVIEAQHTCVFLRGIEHDSIMKTSKLSGAFLDNSDNARTEFYNFITTLK